MLSDPFVPELFFAGGTELAPPASKHLQYEFQDADVDRGWIRTRFTPRPEFLNPAGLVQGGFLVAMLDDTMGPAVLVKSRGKYMTASVDIHAHFLRPVKPEAVYCEAEVTQMGRTIAYIEGKLFDARQRLCVRCVSSAMIMKFPERQK